MVVMTFVCEVEKILILMGRIKPNRLKGPLSLWGILNGVLLLGSCFGVSMQYMPICFDFMFREHWIDRPIRNICFMTSTLLTVSAVRLLMGSLADGEYRDRILMVCLMVFYIQRLT